MTEDRKIQLEAKLAHHEKHAQAIRALLAPAGSIPASCCPTRGAVGEQGAVTNSDTDSPLPDQGWGELRDIIVYLSETAAHFRKAADAAEKEGSKAVPDLFNEQAARCDRWIAALRAVVSEPLTQSAADGDEVEAAVGTAMECLKFTAASVEKAAKRQESGGCPFGAESSWQKAAKFRHAFRVLESFLPELSRKERSVSGNDAIQATAPTTSD